MSKVTEMARGKPCMIRLHGVCVQGASNESTVLAHYRAAGLCGIGIKPPDLIGSWACAACHAAVDGRKTTQYTHEELEMHHLQGVVRTINEIATMYDLNDLKPLKIKKHNLFDY